MRRHGTQLTNLKDTKDALHKPDIRTLFILFILSFASASSPTPVKAAMLEDHKDMFTSIFKGINEDSHEVLRRVLEVCWDGVWCDGKISRTAKIRLFGEGTLNQVCCPVLTIKAIVSQQGVFTYSSRSLKSTLDRNPRERTPATSLLMSPTTSFWLSHPVGGTVSVFLTTGGTQGSKIKTSQLSKQTMTYRWNEGKKAEMRLRQNKKRTAIFTTGFFKIS